MDVFAKVKEIIVDLLEVDPEAVTLKANFRDNLEADSLDLVELLMAFEDTFGSPIPDDEVDMVRGNRVVQNLDRKPSSGLMQPVQVALPGSGKFKQELPLVAAVSDMPRRNLAENIDWLLACPPPLRILPPKRLIGRFLALKIEP